MADNNILEFLPKTNIQSGIQNEKASVTISSLLKTNGFTQEHLDHIINQVLPFFKVHYPELYGNKLRKGMKFIGFKILNFKEDGIEDQFNTQRFRVGGFNTKRYEDIKNNIERNGYKWKYPAPSIVFDEEKQIYTDIITGNTRSKYVSNRGVPNMIWAVYALDDGYTLEHLEEGLERSGIRFNTIHDPAQTATPEDVKANVYAAIKRYERNPDFGCAPEHKAIEEYIDDICGEGIFTPAKRSAIVQEIINNKSNDPLRTVISWEASKARLRPFLFEHNLIETDKVIYKPVATSAYTKAVGMALREARQTKKQIRLVLHTSTLSGDHLKRSYEARISNFVKEFESAIEDFNVQGNDEYRKTLLSKVMIYGAYPAIAKYMDTKKILKFNPKSKEFYQKPDDDFGGYSFSVA